MRFKKWGKHRIFLLVVAGILLAIGVFLLLTLLLKALWAWTIPDLFPGAVAQGLIAKEISWVTAMKLALFSAVFLALSSSHHSHSHSHKKEGS
jgi:phosphotransferase system  glucose/maltose/N-acetylglucosamine-specific IIC component